MALTPNDQLGDTGKQTGFWPEEFAAPFGLTMRARRRLDVAQGSKTERLSQRGQRLARREVGRQVVKSQLA